MRFRNRLLVVAIMATVVACGDDAEPVIDPGDGGDYAVSIDPAQFVTTIDNPWMPLLPGNRWVYEAETDEGIERIEVVVTSEVRTVMGVTTVVVRDTVTLDGELIEDTFDWFAQDVKGNVWYFGEDSKEYEDGEMTTTAGSWEAGVDGALPGIIMPAGPEVGHAYRQEFYAGVAEDMAQVIGLAGSATVPFGAFTGLLVTREWTPLEPDVVEEKYYSRGIGVVQEVGVEGEFDRAELVNFESAG